MFFGCVCLRHTFSSLVRKKGLQGSCFVFFSELIAIGILRALWRMAGKKKNPSKSLKSLEKLNNDRELLVFGQTVAQPYRRQTVLEFILSGLYFFVIDFTTMCAISSVCKPLSQRKSHRTSWMGAIWYRISGHFFIFLVVWFIIWWGDKRWTTNAKTVFVFNFIVIRLKTTADTWNLHEPRV